MLRRKIEGEGKLKSVEDEWCYYLSRNLKKGESKCKGFEMDYVYKKGMGYE